MTDKAHVFAWWVEGYAPHFICSRYALEIDRQYDEAKTAWVGPSSPRHTIYRFTVEFPEFTSDAEIEANIAEHIVIYMDTAPEKHVRKGNH